MIIGEKKYVISKGLAFYSEMESQRLEKELSKGWLIDRISWFGFYRLRKVEPERAQIVIDFYSGGKNETDDYLEFYNVAGWDKVTSYRKRYFIFKADEESDAVYTDEESYGSRLSKEKLWLLFNGCYFFIAGLIGLLLIKWPVTKELLMRVNPVYFVTAMLTELNLMVPLILLSALLYYELIYSKRQSYYKQPENYAKKQHFFIDLIFLMGIGGLLGGVTGFLSSYFSLF